MNTKKKLVVHRVILCVLLALLLVINAACAYSFDYLTKVTNHMGLNLDTEEAEQIGAESLEFSKQLTEEGIVLLRNENQALPLEKGTNVNLFGWSSTQMIVGGSGGSGGVSNAQVNIRTSLEKAGFTINEELWDMYCAYKDARDIVPEDKYGGYSPSWGTPEPEITDTQYYTQEMLDNAKAFSDVAIFTVARSSGEGLDLPPGYLTLTDTEIQVMTYLRENYSKLILLVNANSAVELGPAEEIGVDAILFMPGPGDVGAEALGKILCGEVNPSGHLVDTFAYDHESAPGYFAANRPGTMEYSDQPGYYYVDYLEGIYVGYKYYETAAADGYIDYNSVVQYPFGHGLSYTTFEKHVVDTRGNLKPGDTIEIDVEVTNTGDVAGKDVVQIYATPQYYPGGIEKAAVDLVGFAKTSLLEPGASETVTISVDPFEIASYDWNDANGDGKTGYILEHGTYTLNLMENSHDLIEVAKSYTLDSDILIDQDPVTGAEIKNLFDDVAGQQETEPLHYLSRADFAGTWPEKKDSNTGRKASQAVLDSMTITLEEDPNAKPITTGADNGLTVEDVKDLPVDDPAWDRLLDQLTVDEMHNLIANGAFATPAIDSIGLKSSVHSDGPQGVSSWFTGVSGAGYPVEMYVAQTWNTELAATQGNMFARECRAYGVSAMYAPAVNIHRTPYAGRNFEYYAEDGFLSGKMASAVCYAAREEGVFMFVKHFALNDQETYRGEYFTSLYTWCNEQAMREIYLKGFELAVKEGKATAIMTSFNRVGASWSGACKALCTDLLRNEWGFDGTVITDLYMGTFSNEWWMNLDQGVRAGNDLWLALYCEPGDTDMDLTSVTTQNAMREACRHVIYTISQCEISPETPTPNWFYFGLIPLDVVGAALLVFYGLKIRKNAKKLKQNSAQ